MTKKRFTLREPKIDGGIGCSEIANNGEWITYGEIVDLLNENEELKHELLCKQLDKAPTEPINCKCHYEMRMSENKRFTTVELPKPNKWGIWYDGAYLSTYQVCTLLNEYVDVRKETEQLKQQLEYIQNSISEHIKHQKTELGQKALQEIIRDYNEWLLGLKE